MSFEDASLRRELPLVLGSADAVLLGYRATALPAGRAAAGARVFRIEGVARVDGEARPFDFVRKSVADPRGQAARSDAEFWSREPEAYRSGELASLAGGLRAPRCYRVAREGDCETVLWLEHCGGASARDWDDARMRLAAVHLGEMNGAFLAGARLPSSLVGEGTPRFLRAWLATRATAIEWIRDPAAWRVPDVCDVLTSAFAPRLIALWDEREALLESLEAQPQTVAHLDAHAGNLIDDADAARTVAVDWSHVGPAAAGEELAQFVTEPLLLRGDPTRAARLEALGLDGYLEGLRAAGVEADEARVRRAYAIHAALHWAFGVGFVLRNAASNDARRAYEARLGRPFRALLAEAAARTGFLLERVHQPPWGSSIPR